MAAAASSARGVEPAIAAGTPSNTARSPVTVMRGWMLRASCGASGSSVVAPEKWPTRRPGAMRFAAAPISASGTASSTMSAASPVAPRPSGPADLDARSAECRRHGPPDPPVADDRHRSSGSHGAGVRRHAVGAQRSRDRGPASSPLPCPRLVNQGSKVPCGLAGSVHGRIRRHPFPGLSPLRSPLRPQVNRPSTGGWIVPTSCGRALLLWNAPPPEAGVTTNRAAPSRSSEGGRCGRPAAAVFVAVRRRRADPPCPAACAAAPCRREPTPASRPAPRDRRSRGSRRWARSRPRSTDTARSPCRR